MIRIIKYIFFSITWHFIFKAISKINFKKLLDSIITQLQSLPYKDLFKLIKNLILNKQTDNSILNTVCLPLGFNWKYFFDSNLNKFFLLFLTFSIIEDRWFILVKRLLLWPFKLGIF